MRTGPERTGARRQGRLPRRLVTGNGFRDPKRLQLTSVLFDEPAIGTTDVAADGSVPGALSLQAP